MELCSLNMVFCTTMALNIWEIIQLIHMRYQIIPPDWGSTGAWPDVYLYSFAKIQFPQIQEI